MTRPQNEIDCSYDLLPYRLIRFWLAGFSTRREQQCHLNSSGHQRLANRVSTQDFNWSRLHIAKKLALELRNPHYFQGLISRLSSTSSFAICFTSYSLAFFDNIVVLIEAMQTWYLPRSEILTGRKLLPKIG